MPYNKAYNPINWQNYPSANTPLDDIHLNLMDSAINTIDTRVVSLDTMKADRSDIKNSIVNVEMNDTTGIFTFTKFDGSKFTVDTNLEKVVTNFIFDETTQKLILTLQDGTTQSVDLSAFINEYDFTDSDNVIFEVTNHSVTARIKSHSITGDELQDNFLEDCLSAKAGAEVAFAGAEEAKSAAATSEANAKDAENNASAYYDATFILSQQAKSSEENASSSAASASSDSGLAYSYMESAREFSESASGSANLASESAESASSSASAAKADADRAELAASSVEGVLTQASGYADNAMTSAANSALSANSALDSATNASESESNSSASAVSAAGSESNAQVYMNTTKGYRDEVQAALSSIETAVSQAEGFAASAKTDSENTEQFADHAWAFSDVASTKSLESEGYAVGTQNGIPVGQSSIYYHNNAKYFSQRASSSALNSLTDVEINPSTITSDSSIVYDPNTSKWGNKRVAVLDADGHIPYDILPESAMEYKGLWDALHNEPDIFGLPHRQGDFYIISVTSANGYYKEGDRVIWDNEEADFVILKGGTHALDSDKLGGVDANQYTTLSGAQALTNKTYNGYTLGDASAKGVANSVAANNTDLVTSGAVHTALNSHTSNTSNPHSVTKSQVGLGNVENKSSATIRGELTKDDVTTALGYTPPTTNTTYESKSAASGGTAVSLVTTGEKYTWNNKAGTSVATTSANGLMSSTDKTKLDGIAAGANAYSLPTASSSVLGGVKIGTGIGISSGAISVSYGTAAGTACQGNDSRLSNSRTPTAHNQAASTITAGTLGGKVQANATAAATLTNAQVRDIYAGTSDLTAGTSALTTGTIYLVYE